MSKMMDEVWNRVKRKPLKSFQDHPKSEKFQEVFGLVISLLMSETFNTVGPDFIKKMIVDRGISETEYEELYRWIGGMELQVHLDIMEKPYE